MSRPTVLLGIAPLVVLLIVLAAFVGGIATGAGPAAPQVVANETTTSATSPGAQLAGVVGVQQAEVNGELDNRTFGHRVATANNDAERAAIIAGRQIKTTERLATQTDRLANLRAARANDTIPTAEYRAKVATVAAETANIEREAAQLKRTADKLPPAVRERNSINMSAIEQLHTNAGAVRGSETAAIARSIGGTTARNPMAGKPRDPPVGAPEGGQAARGGSRGEVGNQDGQSDARGNTTKRAIAGEHAQTPGAANDDAGNMAPTAADKRSRSTDSGRNGDTAGSSHSNP